MIKEKVMNGEWVPMKAGRNGPPISHLLFADDILLFAKASEEQMRTVLDALHQFSEASILKVSVFKTSIYFSKSVQRGERAYICEISGYKEVPYLGCYLSSMITNERKIKKNYKTTLEKAKGKMRGWKAHCLSFVGRITLAKSVISAAINYKMMHEKVPKGICYEVEKMQKQLIWGDSEEGRKFHAIGWKHMCKHLNLRGLGFRNLSLLNDAFLMKSTNCYGR
ncbi:hypothetical protein S245_007971 [Arachis hypogaea]